MAAVWWGFSTRIPTIFLAAAGNLVETAHDEGFTTNVSQDQIDADEVGCGMGLQLLAQRSAAQRPPPSLLAVRLLRRLLHWNPSARPTAAAALRHAYFTVPLAKQARHACAAKAGSSTAAGWC